MFPDLLVLKPETKAAFVIISLIFNLQETYPQTAPIWFSDSEDASVVGVVGELANTKTEQFNVSIGYCS